MGAWGIGNFDNDAAMDWMQEFAEHPTEVSLTNVFKSVAESDEFIEVDEGAIVLVAAEIIAAIKGNKSADYSEDMQVFKEINVQDTLVYEALKAIDIVSQSDESELRQLWQETDEFEQWYAVINDLKSRIQN